MEKLFSKCIQSVLNRNRYMFRTLNYKGHFSVLFFKYTHGSNFKIIVTHPPFVIIHLLTYFYVSLKVSHHSFYQKFHIYIRRTSSTKILTTTFWQLSQTTKLFLTPDYFKMFWDRIRIYTNFPKCSKIHSFCVLCFVCFLLVDVIWYIVFLYFLCLVVF